MSEILDLVEAQPKPAVFYKSFLEFNGSNMISILSFDSRSTKSLTDEKHAEFFDEKFPIFYVNKIQKKIMSMQLAKFEYFVLTDDFDKLMRDEFYQAQEVL